MILKKAWRDLQVRKLRAALVVFSVAIAVFGVSSIALLGDQFERSAAERYLSSNPADLTVDTLPMGAAPRDTLRDLYNVQTVEGRVVGTARWKPVDGERTENLAIQGIADFENERALDRVRVVRGTLPQAGEILFEKTARRKYALDIGNKVTVTGPSGEQQYTIAGFGENPNVAAAPVVGFASAWLTRQDAMTVLKLDGDTRVLIAMRDARDAALREATQQRVRESLEGDEITVLASQLRDPATVPGQDILDALHSVLLAFGLCGALVSGLLVLNTISTVVLEQRPQIGTMKAIGGATRSVMAMYLALALLYGLLGTALGLLGGIAFATFSENARAAAQDEPAAGLLLSPQALGPAVMLGIASCLLAALVPSWLGARVTVREALVSYGLSANFGRSLWDRLVLRLQWLPPALLLATRNVFRQPSRALFTLLGLAVATAILLAVLVALNALSASLEAARQSLQADLALSFDSLVERATVEAALNDASAVERRELWLASSAKLGDKTIAVTGLPADTTIFDTSTVREGGHWLAGDVADEAVVTQRLATRRGLTVGSAIELVSGSHPARQWTVVGIVPGAGGDVMAPEGGVYASFESVRALLDFPEGRGNQLYVRLTDRSKAQVDAQARALSDTLADAGASNVPVKLYEQEENTQRIFAGFALLFSLMIVIVSLVGALGLFGTLTMNVVERRREIGVIRSVGGPTRTVLGTFILEGLLLGLLGWAVGIVLGTPASRLLVGFLNETLIPLEYAFPASGVLVAALAILGITFVAGVVPALLAARTRVAEILRYA